MDTWIDRDNIDGAAGLKENRIAGITEPGHEWETFGLGERLSSRHLHEAAPIALYFRQDIVD
jgi:hypothetical protein